MGENNNENIVTWLLFFLAILCFLYALRYIGEPEIMNRIDQVGLLILGTSFGRSLTAWMERDF